MGDVWKDSDLYGRVLEEEGKMDPRNDPERRNVRVAISIPSRVPGTEVDGRFLQGMADRMALSFFKYGRVAEAYPHKVNALESLQKRIERYQETGNTEWLMDVANFAMIEFMHPRHMNAHFEPTDSDQSPGRVWNGGIETATANTVGRENVRRGGSNLRTDGGFYKQEGD